MAINAEEFFVEVAMEGPSFSAGAPRPHTPTRHKNSQPTRARGEHYTRKPKTLPPPPIAPVPPTRRRGWLLLSSDAQAPSVNAVANGPAESPGAVAAPKIKTFPSPSPAAAATKGRGLRRWRRIRRDQERPRDSTGGGDGGGGEGDAQLHKRRLPLAAGGAPWGKHDASAASESSTASVESRFVPLPPLGLGLGFSVGAGNSEDRSSRSSTAAPAPRVPLPGCDHASVVLSPRERDRPRPRAAAASISTEAGCSRSSVESDLRSSNAVVKARQQLGAAGLNGVRKVFSGCCGHGDEEQLSQEVRSTGRCRGNGSSVAGRSVRSSAGEESVGNGGNGRMYWGADPCNESILVLHTAQEALENEIGKIMAIGKEPSDEFDVSDDEWSGSVHLEESNEDLMVRIKYLESRLEEASALIKEKASRAYELEAIHAQMQPAKTTRESTNLLLSQCELDQLYQEKMESEIQCIILTRAYHTSATLAEDQMALYQTQKSLSEDYKLLGLKLQHTESRAMVLEEMAEKLQLQCKELSNSSEVLQLRYKASRVSLFCFVQFLLLCLAMGTYLMRLSPSSTKVVPT
ncbi:WPP domain-interacting protein 1-like [Miscanthus floridulus]|uniref:WPP domain-interacting protein 1-like n=1 Tax=Miscanthus floridulus TaxID=154761 RepID=UPI00345987B7